MKDEIKEILDRLKEDLYIPMEDNREYKLLDKGDDKLLLDYITNLQEKLEVSKTNEETYRLEMEDITKCLGLDEHTIFDEVKEYATNLQEENKRLKELCNEYEEEHNNEFQCWKRDRKELLDKRARNEKAIENIDLVIELIKQQPTEDDTWILNKLNGFKYLLQGEDKDE